MDNGKCPRYSLHFRGGMLLRFSSEKVYKALTNKESVHLEDWPCVPEVFNDEKLLEEIEADNTLEKVNMHIVIRAWVTFLCIFAVAILVCV